MKNSRRNRAMAQVSKQDAPALSKYEAKRRAELARERQAYAEAKGTRT